MDNTIENYKEKYEEILFKFGEANNIIRMLKEKIEAIENESNSEKNDEYTDEDTDGDDYSEDEISKLREKCNHSKNTKHSIRIGLYKSRNK